MTSRKSVCLSAKINFEKYRTAIGRVYQKPPFTGYQSALEDRTLLVDSEQGIWVVKGRYSNYNIGNTISFQVNTRVKIRKGDMR